MSNKTSNKNITPAQPLPQSSSKRDYHLLLLGAVLLIVALLRMRLLSVPLERDEGEYAYMGKLMLDGIAPYKYSYNMKLPGTYAMYALLMTIFGKSITGVHIGLLLVNTLTSLFLFLGIRKLFNPTVALITASVYAMMSVSPVVLGFAAHATQFVSLFVALGVWLYAKYTDSHKPFHAILTGAMFGLALLMKQQAVFFILFGGIMMLLHKQDRAATIKGALFYSIGAIMPYAITALLLYSAGVWDKFWFWTVTYASSYAAGLSFEDGKEFLGSAVSSMWSAFPLVWLLAIAGLIFAFTPKVGKEQKMFATLFLLFAIWTVCPGFYFRPHYFVTFLPALALLTGIGVDAIASRTGRQSIILPVAVVAVVLIISIGKNKDYYFDEEPDEISKTMYGSSNPFVEAVEVARYIKDNSKENTKIAVLGSEPEIPFYANRMSATGYIYVYPLVELHKDNKRMQQEMINEIQKNNPDYLIFCRVDASWVMHPGAPTDILNWFFSYTKDKYEVVGVTEVGNAGEAHYVWGNDAKQYKPQAEQFMLIFKRKV
ncbi:MAG: glycosyltransferase family 39 protein [Bacteroidetes bacterium]|nr:glycosyltransferase family 39 protein [Bacteroidota bacterium]